MKGLLFLLAFAISSVGYAQAVNGGLKGPAAKNYKYWLDKNKPVATEVVTGEIEPLQGPAAKNTAMHKRRSAMYTVVETNVNRPQLIGPKAKNTSASKYSGLASNKIEQERFSSTKNPSNESEE